MRLPLRLLLVVGVVALGACRKKAEAPASNSTAATSEAPAAPAAPATSKSEPAQAPMAAMPSTPIPGELPIIAKARAYVGSDAPLNGVRSIHYVGTVTTSDTSNPPKQTRAKLDMIFQKPDQQRISATNEQTIETTALNGYDCWTRIQSVADRTKWQQTLLGSEQLKRLRAQAWEYLYFYRGIEKIGGRAEDQGKVQIDGITCEKVAFIHPSNIIFYRFFDVASGRLVYSETDLGMATREQGENIVNGIRFPKTVTTVTKLPSGQSQTVTLTFDKITVNENFPDSTFAMPSLLNR
jgi:hypothetical protein